MNSYQQSKEEVFSSVNSSEHGLSQKEAEKRLRKYGPNALKKKRHISPFTTFLNQFKSVIIWVLLGAILISIILGQVIDSIVIGIIVILNAVFGFVQEYKAEKSIEALKKLAYPKAKVLRDSKEVEIPSKEIVPGDVLILREGDRVAADCRLFVSESLETQEGALTGESSTVHKTTKKISKKKDIADRNNMVFAGTAVAKGYGKAIVTGTGMSTEIGKIADMITSESIKKTPLQKKLAKLGRTLSLAVLIICVAIFTAYALKDITNLIEPLMTAVSLAVAAIPEGLPAVVTISLAIGVKRMVKKNVLMRKLPSVETLGCTTVICSDKTGTLTHNEMTVKKVFVDDKTLDVSGEGYNKEGSFSEKTRNLNLLLKCGILCNDATINKGKAIGDPTEAALIISANKMGLKRKDLDKKSPRKKEIAFSSERKRMSTIHKEKGKYTIYTKGAPDTIIHLCTHIIKDGKRKKLTKKDKKKIIEKNEELADQALRVLGFAYKISKKSDIKEKNLTFIGLQAMKDPARKTVKKDIEQCHKAGIRVIMITGDHKITAKAVAREIGIEGDALTGDEIPENLEEIINKVAIYARVNPEHKMKIIDALKKKGHIVAMTGDGVNDAPALKKSDIGISMGVKGTEVAKESSDMILTDDAFSSIVNAVKEGRGIYNNIKKFVNYLLSSNMGEILLIFIATLLGMPLPLIAIQILWVNLITDGLPALALGVDPIREDVMERPPRNPKEHIVNKNLAIKILFMGSLIGISSLLLFQKFLPNIETARTVAFTALAVFELSRIYTIRSEDKNKLFSNKYLTMAIAISILLQLVVIYSPLNIFFKTVPLGILEWAYILGAATAILIVGRLSLPVIKKISRQED